MSLDSSADVLILPPSPRAPARARAHAAALVADCDPTVRDAVLLVVSEAVTNAVRHGAGNVELTVTVLDDRVHIEVSDGGTAWSSPGRLPPADGVVDSLPEGGRGLPLIDALARAWGARARTGAPGTTVWFDVGLSVD